MRSQPPKWMVSVLLTACFAGCGLVPNEAGNRVSEAPEEPPLPELVDAGDAPERITNSIGMKLVLISAGDFQMGNNEPEEVIFADFPLGKPAEILEEIPHEVRISRPFYMGQYEVTVGQFRAFVESTDFESDAEKDGEGGEGIKRGDSGPIVTVGSRYTWKYTGFEQTDDHPVVNVTWNDADAFCRWLSGIEVRRYRLPTEAEWEYACRAGSKDRFTFGSDLSELVEHANLADRSLQRRLRTVRGAIPLQDGHTFTAPVGSFQPNAWGLYDMHGNVNEWTSDWFLEGYLGASPASDPLGPGFGTNKVIKGGGWISNAVLCRCSSREIANKTYRDASTGFRVVLEVEALEDDSSPTSPMSADPTDASVQYSNGDPLSAP